MVESKVTAATVGSPVAALIVFVVGLLGPDMPVEAALGAVAVLTPVVTFAAGYFTSSRTSIGSDDCPIPIAALEEPPGTTSVGPSEEADARRRHPS